MSEAAHTSSSPGGLLEDEACPCPASADDLTVKEQQQLEEVTDNVTSSQYRAKECIVFGSPNTYTLSKSQKSFLLESVLYYFLYIHKFIKH